MSNEADNVMLMHGDCLALMANMAPQSVDAIITDPPYGTTVFAWDTKLDLERWWGEVRRVIKPNGVVAMFSQQPFTTDLINSNRGHFRYEMIWRKTSPVGFLDAKIRPMRLHENILVFCDQYRGRGNRMLSTYNPQFTYGKPYAKTRTAPAGRMCHYGRVTECESRSDGRRYPVDVLEFANRAGKSYHPTQKPLGLVVWLVRTYSNVGELVLDPFMGGGTTGLACQQAERRFIGIERDDVYFEVATRRILGATAESAG